MSAAMAAALADKEEEEAGGEAGPSSKKGEKKDAATGGEGEGKEGKGEITSGGDDDKGSSSIKGFGKGKGVGMPAFGRGLFNDDELNLAGERNSLVAFVGPLIVWAFTHCCQDVGRYELIGVPCACTWSPAQACSTCWTAWWTRQTASWS